MPPCDAPKQFIQAKKPTVIPTRQGYEIVLCCDAKNYYRNLYNLPLTYIQLKLMHNQYMKATPIVKKI